jgi:hypothetical protein
MAYFRQYLAAENNLAIFRHFRGAAKIAQFLAARSFQRQMEIIFGG